MFHPISSKNKGSPSKAPNSKNLILQAALLEMPSAQENGRRARGNFKIPELNAEQKKRWDDGVKAASAKLLSSQVQNESVLGTRYLQRTSTIAYKKHLQGLRYFCFLIADFDSLLILLEEAPAGRLPSVNV